MQIMDSDKVFDYFINDQAMGRVCAASLIIYLRYFSTFLFYLHDKNRNYFLMRNTKSWIKKLQGSFTIITTLVPYCFELRLFFFVGQIYPEIFLKNPENNIWWVLMAKKMPKSM